jgi:hypothetical protein
MIRGLSQSYEYVMIVVIKIDHSVNNVLDFYLINSKTLRMVYCLSLLYIKELYFIVYFICKNNKSGFPVNKIRRF